MIERGESEREREKKEGHRGGGPVLGSREMLIGLLRQIWACCEFVT